MPYLTIREIMDRVRSFHGELGEIYSQSSGVAEDEKARLLLSYMVEQEEKIRDSLKRYETKFSNQVLDTWIQFIPEKPLKEILRDLNIQPEMTLDEVLERALRADRAVAKIFHQMAGATTAPRVQEFFEGLHDMENAKSSDYSQGALGARNALGS